jgi:hypothetical protein
MESQDIDFNAVNGFLGCLRLEITCKQLLVMDLRHGWAKTEKTPTIGVLNDKSLRFRLPQIEKKSRANLHQGVLRSEVSSVLQSGRLAGQAPAPTKYG